MSYNSITILEAMDNIKDYHYVLPDIQREYVWKMEQIEKLFDSLLSDYPIGTFLFWEVLANNIENHKFYLFQKDFNKEEIDYKDFTSSGKSNIIAVVDGQQRLTSLYIGLYGSYTEKDINNDEEVKKYLYINLNYIYDKNGYNDNEYQFKFLSEEEAIKKNNTKDLWVKVSELSNFLSTNKYKSSTDNNLKNNISKIVEKFDKRIKEDKIINFYKIDIQELDKILNMFIRVNIGGTKLHYSDLILSKITVVWKNNDAKKSINMLMAKIKKLGFKVSKDFILKASLMLTDNNIKFEIKNFTNDKVLEIENSWKIIEKYLMLSFKILKYFGYNKDYINSYNAILPISYYLKNINADNNFIHNDNKDCLTVLKWFRIASIKSIFSDSSDSTLSKYRDIIKDNVSKYDKKFPINIIKNAFKNSKREDISFTKDYASKIIQNANYQNKKVLYPILLSVLGTTNIERTIDHLYPKSLFNDDNIIKYNLNKKDIDKFVNNISNLQFLTKNDNKMKSNQNFEDWIKSKDSDYKVINLIPNIDYKLSNFIIFCKERQKLMIDKLYLNLEIEDDKYSSESNIQKDIIGSIENLDSLNYNKPKIIIKKSNKKDSNDFPAVKKVIVKKKIIIHNKDNNTNN